MVSVIGAVATIATAAFTTYATIETSSNKLDETRDRITALSDQADAIERVLPIGTIVSYGGDVDRRRLIQLFNQGWLLCRGQTLDRTIFDPLWDIIGETYSDGAEPAGRFRLPDLRGRAPIGSGQGRDLSNRILGRPGGSEIDDYKFLSDYLEIGGNGSAMYPKESDFSNSLMQPYLPLNFLIFFSSSRVEAENVDLETLGIPEGGN